MAPSPPPAGSAGRALPFPECALPRESICTGSGQAVSGSAIALVGPMYREPLFAYQTSVFADLADLADLDGTGLPAAAL